MGTGQVAAGGRATWCVCRLPSPGLGSQVLGRAALARPPHSWPLRRARPSLQEERPGQKTSGLTQQTLSQPRDLGDHSRCGLASGWGGARRGGPGGGDTHADCHTGVRAANHSVDRALRENMPSAEKGIRSEGVCRRVCACAEARHCVTVSGSHSAELPVEKVARPPGAAWRGRDEGQAEASPPASEPRAPLGPGNQKPPLWRGSRVTVYEPN